MCAEARFGLIFGRFVLSDFQVLPQAYGWSDAGDPAKCGMVVKALGGTALSYSVNELQGANSTYEVSLVVERLE
jgi:hypothetical protein